MLIKEYRIPLPLTVEEYRIAQLYMIQVRHSSSTSRPITPSAEKGFLLSLVLALFPASHAPDFIACSIRLMHPAFITCSDILQQYPAGNGS